MIKQYILISKTVLVLLAGGGHQWATEAQQHPISTAYTYESGDTVYVYDSTYIDSLGLRGWTDAMVQYPINKNDSNDVHIVNLNDSMIIRKK